MNRIEFELTRVVYGAIREDRRARMAAFPELEIFHVFGRRLVANEVERELNYFLAHVGP